MIMLKYQQQKVKLNLSATKHLFLNNPVFDY